MAVIRVSLDAFAATVKADLASLRPEALRTLQNTVQLNGPRLYAGNIARASPRPPVDRGTYRRNLHVDDTADGTVMYNRTKYAGVIELGRRPGKMPPVAALAGWVKRKGITRDPQEARQIAYAIARKMKKEGWPFSPNQPMRIMGKTAEQLEPLLLSAMDEMLRNR